jgi:hypothetical protein
MTIRVVRNVVNKDAGKEVKHKSLCVEIHEMYNYTNNNCSRLKTNKRYKGNYTSHSRKHSIDSQQHTAVLGTLTR